MAYLTILHTHFLNTPHLTRLTSVHVSVINGCSLHPALTCFQLFDWWARWLDRWTDEAWKSNPDREQLLGPAASCLAWTQRGDTERISVLLQAQIGRSWTKQQLVDILTKQHVENMKLKWQVTRFLYSLRACFYYGAFWESTASGLPRGFARYSTMHAKQAQHPSFWAWTQTWRNETVLTHKSNRPRGYSRKLV